MLGAGDCSVGKLDHHQQSHMETALNAPKSGNGQCESVENQANQDGQDRFSKKVMV